MAVTLDSLIYCEGEWSTQLALLMLWACFWYLLLPFLAKSIIMPWICSKPWKEQWADLSDKYFKSAFMLDLKNKELSFEFACLFAAIVAQHVVGGLLCLPSVLGYQGRAVSAMACHGGLCEAGWELQDVAVRAYWIAFMGEEGKARNPPAVVPIVLMHHLMGMCMVVPMNVLYHDFAYYHELVFLLQGAAAVALLAQNFGFTLDINTAPGLKQMKCSVALVCTVMVYSRVFRFWFVGYKIISAYRADGHYGMLAMGGFVLVLMGLFNVLLVGDSISKACKFLPMEHTDEEVTEAAIDAHRSFSRTSSSVFLPKSRRAWAKVRGAVHMGAFHSATVVPNLNSEKQE